MGRITWAVAQFRFIANHHWPDAPPDSILKNLHRHEFHVKVSLTVFHDDREIEFQALKDDVRWFLEEEREHESTEMQSWSCEEYAAFILEHLEIKYPGRDLQPRQYRVSVYEDGENGAEVEA